MATGVTLPAFGFLLDHLLSNGATSLSVVFKDSRILVSHPSHWTKVKCSRSWWVQSSWLSASCSKTLTEPRAKRYILHMSEKYAERTNHKLPIASTCFFRVSLVQCNMTGICIWLVGQSSDIDLSNLFWLNSC